MTAWQSALLGLLQGATELFPVSSLGHAVIIPTLLHWTFKQSDPTFLPFLVLLHLGTAGALLVLYWRDWLRIVSGFVRAALRGGVRDGDERLAMLLVVGTVPTGLVGVFFQKQLQALFASPRAAAVFLIVNGVLLFGAELLRRRAERRARLEGKDREEQEEAFTEVSGLGYRNAALIGVCQVLALFPGISRSGVTMAGGLLAGLRHEESARFSFLLATRSSPPPACWRCPSSSIPASRSAPTCWARCWQPWPPTARPDSCSGTSAPAASIPTPRTASWLEPSPSSCYVRFR